MRKSVVQEWALELSYMQQSVLLAAIRGPDGIDKNHVSKLLLRWFRRCVLIAAFEDAVLALPYDPPKQAHGGSFTGPSCHVVMHEGML